MLQMFHHSPRSIQAVREAAVGCKSRPSYRSSDNEHESRSHEPLLHQRRGDPPITHPPDGGSAETIVWSGESLCTHHCWLSYAQLLTVPLLSSSQTYVDLRNPDSPSGILAGVDLSWLYTNLSWVIRWVLRVLNTCNLRSSFI